MSNDTAVRQLLDIEAIKTLKHRYIRSMTMSQWALMESLLTEDVQDRDWRICSTGYRRIMEQSLDRATLPGLRLLKD